MEQKNDDKVRKLVGYYRYDTPREVELLNKLYERADILDNFFIPSSKLVEKIRTDNGRVKRRVHDKPKTPFQRLIDSNALTKHEKQKLKRIFKSLDMVVLRQDVNGILKVLYDMKLKSSRKKITI